MSEKAFLHRDLEDKIYIELPLGFRVNLKGKKVYKLKKACMDQNNLHKLGFQRFLEQMIFMGYK